VAKKAVIVESPTKAQTIKGFLGRDYVVLSSKGHIKDLPKSRLGVIVENNFEPTYITIRGKKKVINELRKALKKEITEIYLGCDPDREGEAIAYHIANELSTNHKGTDLKANIRRVLFYEITPSFVRDALLHPVDIDLKKVDAHKARRVLDRLFGYFTSPLLWSILRRGLSAGRVQTVALRILCEREVEITSFKPVPYWVVEVKFRSQAGLEFCAHLHRIDGMVRRIEKEEEVTKLRQSIKVGDQLTVKDYRVYDRNQKPAAPFITSTLQQEAVHRLSFSASKTMRFAQILYEGVDLQEGRIGLVTYMRTDSKRVAESAITELREFIRERFGRDYLSPTIHKYKDRKTSEGAHEAIRPTSMQRTPESVKQFLQADEYKLYAMIYDRFLATQMADAVYEVKEAIIESPDGRYEFKGEATRLKFPGHQRAFSDTDSPVTKGALPELKAGEKALLLELVDEKKFSEPPGRYSEASLIKKLEVNGIGRPSTYAKILQTLFERQYAERERGRLFPTELGMIVNKVLIPKFSDIFALPFTASMEEELDLVEEGRKQWQDVVKKFYDPFIIQVKAFESAAPDIKKSLVTKTDRTCPQCGHALIIKWGRYGKFYSCEKFPDCKYTGPLEQQAKYCPKCNSPMVLRTGRFGRFFACTKYPECKHTERFSINRTEKPKPPDQ